MKTVFIKKPLGSILTFNGGERALLCGRLPNGHGLIARDWSSVEDEKTKMAGDETFFAPFVRKHRLGHYRGHIARARPGHGVKDFLGEERHYGKTWIIAGSAPSLAPLVEVIRHARESRDDIYVMAANAALNAIGHEHSDGFMVLCWLSNAAWWERMKPGMGVKLFTSFYNPAEVLDHFSPDDTYHFASPLRDPMCEYAEKDIAVFGALDCGLSVTYSALNLAYRAKAKKIIFVGQDMAYTGGLGHVNEALTWGLAEERKVLPVRDIHGNVTLTDPRLRRHCALLRGAIYWCEKNGVPTYNSSDAGILDLGPTRTKPLTQALEE